MMATSNEVYSANKLLLNITVYSPILTGSILFNTTGVIFFPPHIFQLDKYTWYFFHK